MLATPGTLKPFIVITSAGGTVILPILKQHKDTETVWSVAPSGSGSDARDAVTAWSAEAVSAGGFSSGVWLVDCMGDETVRTEALKSGSVVSSESD